MMKFLIAFAICYAFVSSFLKTRDQWDRYFLYGDPKRKPR